MSDSLIELPVGWTPASVLVNATGDAMDNIFDVLIGWPWQNGDLSGAEAAASYRCSGFKIPEPQTPTYKVYWRGVEVNKIASGIKMDRKLELTFRLDANYALYQKFIAWKKLTGDVNTSGVANTESALGTIRVVAPGAEYNSMSWSTPDGASAEQNLVSQAMQKTTMLAWTFEDVQVFNVSMPEFKNGSTEGKAISYKVSATFGDVSYPFYTAANGVLHSHKQ